MTWPTGCSQKNLRRKRCGHRRNALVGQLQLLGGCPTIGGVGHPPAGGSPSARRGALWPGDNPPDGGLPYDIQASSPNCETAFWEAALDPPGSVCCAGVRIVNISPAAASNGTQEHPGLFRTLAAAERVAKPSGADLPGRRHMEARWEGRQALDFWATCAIITRIWDGGRKIACHSNTIEQ